MSEEDPDKLLKKLGKAEAKIAELTEIIEELKPRGDIWNEVEDKWYNDRDLLNRFKLLKRSIVDLKICNNVSCEVFKPISALEEDIDDIDFTNLTEAKEHLGEKSPAFIQFKRDDFETLKDKLIGLKELIFQLHSVKVGKQDLINKAEKRRNTMIELCGKNGVPYQTSVGEDADKLSRMDEQTLMPNDPALKTTYGIFEKEKEKPKVRGA